MGSGDTSGPRDLKSASLWKKSQLWWRLELGAYKRLRIELPTFEQEFCELKSRSPKASSAWSSCVDALLDKAYAKLPDEPEIAWRCYKTATRMALLALEEENDPNRAEIESRAVEILRESKEKLKNWRGDSIQGALSDDKGEVKANLAVRSLIRAQKVLDESYDNLHRKLKVLRKRLRVLEAAGVAVTAAWIAFWPTLGRSFDSAGIALGRPWIAPAVALMGLTGSIVSGFSATKGVEDSRVPLQEAELAIMIGRMVFGTITALAVVSLVASGAVNLGTKATIPELLAAAFVSGFSERLVVSAVNSFGGKAQQ